MTESTGQTDQKDQTDKNPLGISLHLKTSSLGDGARVEGVAHAGNGRQADDVPLPTAQRVHDVHVDSVVREKKI